MSRKRLSKKQLKHDRFVQRTFDWVHWAETHRREMVGGAIALAVLVAGFFVYRGVSRGAEEDAARDYLMARQGYFAGNYPLAVSDLQGFLDRHGGTPYADDALLFLGESQLQSGQPTEAVTALEKLLDEHGSSPLADNARRLLAVAYGQAGQLDRAVEKYREAIEKAPFDEQKLQIHESLARLYETQSRTEEAVAEYQAIIDLQPEGPAADEARREIAELTVQPLTGTASRSDAGPQAEVGAAESASP
ncbi:MAG TPA: tetratricopeptide repeat protein [Gemmatimonadota bacterium]|nr:tetratricopeptide repeat protein [Gemmatimonadota bacterium]